MASVMLYAQPGRLQRALLHQWQTASYLLTAEALILGLNVSMGSSGAPLPLTGLICLVLAAPIALAAAEMRLRRYKVASMCGTLGGALHGFIVLAMLYALLPWLLQPWLGDATSFAAPIVQLQLMGLITIAVPLTGAAVSGVAWGRALRIPAQPRRLRAKA